MRFIGKETWLLYMILLSVLIESCSRNNIEFGNVPDNNYTNVVYIDSVQPQLSTIVLDSFATGNAASFLLGKYKDPYLGVVSTRPFFQMTIPGETIDIASSSQYDSACFIIHLNKYYYGDTSREQTINIHELEQAIEFTYNNNLYNTSNIAVKPDLLGSKTLKVRPSVDSIIIRLNDSKGKELYNKIQQHANEVISYDNFQSYFKGVSLSVNSDDTTAIYGLNGSDSSAKLRIYYHTTIPYKENKWIDFNSIQNSYAFNQIITDRSGTPIYSSTTGLKQYPSGQTGNVSFTQYGAGVLLKITFPSLKSIITNDKIIKLQKAELIFRPVGQSYDDFKFKLPASLYMAQTNGTNVIGASVLDSISNLQTISPVVDELYGRNTYYRFDISSYISSMLNNAGTEDLGFFLLEDNASPKIRRAIIGDGKQPLYQTKLLLTIISINK